MKNSLAEKIQQRLIIILGFVVVVMLLTQFIILARVGTIGPEISSLRASQQQVKLDIELTNAEIRQLQTNTEVKETVEQDLQMEEKEIGSVIIYDNSSLATK